MISHKYSNYIFKLIHVNICLQYNLATFYVYAFSYLCHSINDVNEYFHHSLHESTHKKLTKKEKRIACFDEDDDRPKP